MSILIVEDESTIADTISIALENEHFKTNWVTTGTAALEETSAETELVILDIGLPDMNGFDVLKKLRADGHLTPVLFLTARNEEVDRIVGLELGADDYVTKPFSPRELVARIRAILRRTSSQTVVDDKAKNSRFAIDESAASISYCNTQLALTKSEYLLLKGMINQPGRVFSRTQLMDMIWETPHPSDERTIDSHIKTLRSKLRDIEPGENPISTHRGLGYSISTQL